MRFRCVLLVITFLLNLLITSFAQEPMLLDHGGGVRTVEFSPVDASLVASAGESSIIKLWNLRNNTVRTIAGHTSRVNSVAFSPDGELLASVSDDGTIKLWNVRNQQNVRTLQDGTWYRSVVFSPDGQILATGGGRHVKLWDTRRWWEIATLQHEQWVQTVAFSPDGQLLAAGDGSEEGPGTVKVWDIERRQVVVPLDGDPKNIKTVAFSPDGRYLASSGWDGQLKVWDISNWNLLRTIPHTGYYDIDFSHDGKMLASTNNGYVNIWWVEDGVRAVQLPGPTDWIHPVDFSHDGASIAVGAEDGIVRIWRVSTSPIDRVEADAVKILHIDTYLQQLPKSNSANGDNIPQPIPPPPVVRDFFGLDPFYEQWINVGGLPVIASAEVSPYALKEAAWLILKMIGHRPDVLRALIEKKSRIPVIGHTEMLTDIPEYSDMQPDFYWDRRARGLGGLIPSANEENLLNGGDRYDVLIHEFAHTIHDIAMQTVDGTFDNQVVAAYDAAMENGLWQSTYAATNKHEYWAESSQAWFHAHGGGSFASFGETRADLKAYDPNLAALLTEVYGDTEWRYTPLIDRIHLPHLQGFDPRDAPTFQWPEALEKTYTQLKDPNVKGSDTWINLRMYQPRELSHLLRTSRVRGESTKVLFFALASFDVLVYKVSLNGMEAFIKRFPAGHHQLELLDLQAGDIFLVKDTHAKNLAVFQAEEKTGRAIYVGDNDSQLQVLKGMIPDPNLAAAVRKTLGLASNVSITKKAMRKLKELKAPNSKIKDLTGLEQATQLTRLDLQENQISNLSPLVGLKKLWRLELWNNQIRDISPLAGLTNLTGLFLSGNQIRDITPVAGLKKLQGLGLGYNTPKIRDIMPLADLKKLEWLRLVGNQIRDVTPLAELRNLDTLYLQENPIQNMSPLKKMLAQNPDLSLDIINLVSPLSRITGPWLWMIAPVKGGGGKRAINIDSLAKASGGAVTEAKIARRGARAGDRIGKYAWTLGKIDMSGSNNSPDGFGNNVNDVINKIGLVNGGNPASRKDDIDINNHSSYALITLRSAKAQKGITMRTGSDDAIKVWLNGKVVHNNPTNRGVGDFQEAFNVDLKKGNNLLLVKVSERDGLWSMFVGVEADVETKKRFVAAPMLSVSEMISPTETVLLLNYPNPFNPETWIPYQLSEPAEVTLTIYAVNGNVVRRLVLGHQPAGMYHSKSRAAYWDGRNEHGERVASGVYFYTLSAGDFIATQKMLIRK